MDPCAKWGEGARLMNFGEVDWDAGFMMLVSDDGVDGGETSWTLPAGEAMETIRLKF